MQAENLNKELKASYMAAVPAFRSSPTSSPILSPGTPIFGLSTLGAPDTPGTPPASGTSTPLKSSPSLSPKAAAAIFFPPSITLPPSLYQSIMRDSGSGRSSPTIPKVSVDLPDLALCETMMDIVCKNLPIEEVSRFWTEFPKTNYHYHRVGEIPGQQAVYWISKIPRVIIDGVPYRIALDTRTYMFVRVLDNGSPLEPWLISSDEYANTSGSPNPHFQKFIELTSMAGYDAHSRKPGGVTTSKRTFFMECFDHLWSALRFVPGHLLLDYIVTENRRQNVFDSELMIDCFDPMVDGVDLSDEFKACFTESVTTEDGIPSKKFAFDGESALHCLAQTDWVQNYVDKYSAQIQAWDAAVKKKHGDFVLLPRYIPEIQRTEVTDAQYFAAKVGAIYLAQALPGRVVGVDFVGAEHHAHFMEHHVVQYAMTRFLKDKYEFNNIAMHVGETNKFDKASYVATAISKVIDIVNPPRLGHVACLVDDPNALRILKTGKTAVVICLSSNDWMLDITPDMHPLTLLKNSNARILIGSDDAAVNNCSLSQEYAKVFKMADKTYSWLKQVVIKGLLSTFASVSEKDRLFKLAHAKFEDFEIRTIKRLKIDHPYLFDKETLVSARV